MEQPPHHHEPGEPSPETQNQHDDGSAAADWVVNTIHISRGIAEAMTDGRAIDDATARRIASLLHSGEGSALADLASAGALPDGIEIEIANVTGALPMEYESWGDVLLDYVTARAKNRGPQAGWARLVVEDENERARAAANRERRDRRARFEHYVSLGMNAEDAASAVEAADMLRPLRPDAQANAPPEDPEPTSTTE